MAKVTIGGLRRIIREELEKAMEEMGGGTPPGFEKKIIDGCEILVGNFEAGLKLSSELQEYADDAFFEDNLHTVEWGLIPSSNLEVKEEFDSNLESGPSNSTIDTEYGEYYVYHVGGDVHTNTGWYAVDFDNFGSDKETDALIGTHHEIDENGCISPYGDDFAPTKFGPSRMFEPGDEVELVSFDESGSGAWVVRGPDGEEETLRAC